MNAEEPELVSAFPAPPKFSTLYGDGSDAGPPPPPPLKPTYHSFGTPYSTEDSVPDLLPEDKKLYPSNYNVKEELKKLNRSLVYSFIELLDVLILNPTKFNTKIDDIELLFLNLHNLINSYRPHQARESLIERLKKQIQDRKNAIADIRQVIDNSKQAVQSTHAALDIETSFEINDVDMEGMTTTISDPQHEAVNEADAANFAKLQEKKQLNQDMQDVYFATCQAILDSSALSHSV